jgi:hypothetical protein
MRLDLTKLSIEKMNELLKLNVRYLVDCVRGIKRFTMNSSLLCLTQPCCYWVFDGYLENIEREETEYRKELAEEIWDTDKTGKNILLRRMDLPKDHPDYQGLVECELDWTKAREIIARAWVKTLQEFCGNEVKIEFKDTWSPKEYNHNTDNSGFFLSATKKVLNSIIAKCLVEYRVAFVQYLRDHHSSYDGFASYMSNAIEDYDEYWELFKLGKRNTKYSLSGGDEVDHLIWACFDFWLLGIESEGDGKDIFSDNQNSFDQALWENVMDADFSNIMEYVPVVERVVA